MRNLNDPMGQAIVDFAETGIDQDIIVSSDLCEDDVISSAYLFRSYDDMPEIEQVALNRCVGKILDIGAGAGVHAQYLKEQGKDVSCIDISPLSVQHTTSIDISSRIFNFYDLKDEKYDTLLLLMNGIGIAGTLSNLEHTLLKAKSLLNEGGKVLCDSSDIKYLYEDDEGGMWVDLNTTYYGNFKFQMKYKGHETEWFDWLYVDFDSMLETAERVGFLVNKLVDQDNQYLVELIKK